MSHSFRHLVVAGTVGTLLAFVGCIGSNDNGPPGATDSRPTPATSTEDHGHKPGSHGGLIVPIGRDNYHAEAVFEKDGVVRLFMLDKDEAKVVEVEAEPLAAYVKSDAATEAASFLFKPEPQQGDSKGRTSRFLGVLPREAWGRKVEVTIPTIRIGEERFRFGFDNAAQPHAEEEMPAKVADETERKLYLTAGGKYTADDIKANGGQTASRKFKDFQASHDLKPKTGDFICPVTLTKANPKCTWVVGGREYQFCCPPCVDEFVQLAKDRPDEVKSPEEYRKK